MRLSRLPLPQQLALQCGYAGRLWHVNRATATVRTAAAKQLQQVRVPTAKQLLPSSVA